MAVLKVASTVAIVARSSYLIVNACLTLRLNQRDPPTIGEPNTFGKKGSRGRPTSHFLTTKIRRRMQDFGNSLEDPFRKLNRTRKSPGQRTLRPGLLFVAGVGFEPTTFGL